MIEIIRITKKLIEIMPGMAEVMKLVVEILKTDWNV